MPDFSKIQAPLLSNANWGGQGLHPRGNFEGFLEAGCEEKWLEVHGIEHWTEFYTDYGVNMQKKFFGYYLKGEDTGWPDQPRVLLQVRHPGERFVERHENEWPLARTQWTKYYLNAKTHTLEDAPVAEAATATYAGFSEGVTFITPPIPEETEVTGPIAASFSYRRKRRMRICSSSCASSRPTWKKSSSRRARPAHPHRAGLAAGIAQKTRPRKNPALQALSHAR